MYTGLRSSSLNGELFGCISRVAHEDNNVSSSRWKIARQGDSIGTSIKIEAACQVPHEMFIVRVIIFKIAQLDSAFLSRRNRNLLFAVKVSRVPLDNIAASCSPFCTRVRNVNLGINNNGLCQGKESKEEEKDDSFGIEHVFSLNNEERKILIEKTACIYKDLRHKHGLHS